MSVAYTVRGLGIACGRSEVRQGLGACCSALFRGAHRGLDLAALSTCSSSSSRPAYWTTVTPERRGRSVVGMGFLQLRESNLGKQQRAAPPAHGTTPKTGRHRPGWRERGLSHTLAIAVRRPATARPTGLNRNSPGMHHSIRCRGPPPGGTWTP